MQTNRMAHTHDGRQQRQQKRSKKKRENHNQLVQKCMCNRVSVKWPDVSAESGIKVLICEFLHISLLNAMSFAKKTHEI